VVDIIDIQSRIKRPKGSDDEQIDREIKIAEVFFNELLEKSLEMEKSSAGQAVEITQVGIIFSMWVDLTHILAMCGWTPAELAKEAVDHAMMEYGVVT